jgi:hypothetical protein
MSLENEIWLYTRLILDNEELHDWKIRFMGGDEGFLEEELKTIVLGRDNMDYKWLVLHEITHTLLPLENDYRYNHYGKIFNDLYKKLCVKYKVNGESWYSDGNRIKHETIFWKLLDSK